MPPPPRPSNDGHWREVEAALDDEIQRLPDKYRTPFILCFLEGHGRAEVARQLGLKEGTVWSRLSTARRRLQVRLARRGIALGAALAAAQVAEGSACTAIPAGLGAATARAAAAWVASPGGAGVSAEVAALAGAALRSMTALKAKVGLGLLLLAGAVGLGMGALVDQTPNLPGTQPPSKTAAKDPVNPDGDKQTGRRDRQGDALPEQALARLGTIRFRLGTSVHITQFSPDGKNLLLGGAGEKGLALWDVASGRRVRDFPIDNYPMRAAFSPDGKLLAVGSIGTSLWETSSGRRVRTLDKEFAGAVAFARDRTTLAVGTPQGVDLWDVTTGKRLRQFSHGAQVRDVAYPFGGKALISAGEDGTVRLWDLENGKELRRWDTKKGPFLQMAASPTQPRVALADEETLRLFNVQTGKEIRLLGPTPYQRGAVAFSADGKLLASAHDPGKMYLWDPATGKEKLHWKTTRPSMVHTLAFSPDGKTLVTSGHNCSGVQWWDARTGKEIIQPQVGHGGWVKSVGFSRDGKDLFSLDEEGSLLSWSADGKNRGRYHLPFCAAAGYAPDGKTTLSVELGGKVDDGFDVRLRDSATGKPIRSLGKVPFANQVAFSPDGKSFALAEAERGTLTVSVRDLATGKPRRRLTRPGNRLYFGLAFSPDGKTIAAGSWAERPNFHLWDLQTGKEIPSCNPDHWVNSIAFSPGGDLVALGSGGDFASCVSVWKLGTRTEWKRFPVGGPDIVSAFSPSGRFLATGTSLKNMARGPKAEESAVRVWEIATGKEVASFQGHQSSITAVAFAPDGKSLASGGGDSTILIWDLVGRLRKRERRQPPAAAELQARWQELAGADAALAYKAIGDLVLSGDVAVTFLKARLFPVPIPDPALARRATQLVGQLDADTFDVRQKAALELEKLGKAAVPALRKALASRPSLEAHKRIERILAGFEREEAPLRLRNARALEALELIATPAARKLLRRLSNGDPSAWLTEEARAAQKRLGR